jgi:hypothetical protein
MKRIVLSAACLAVVVSTAAFATQDEWVRQVRRQLVGYGEQLANRGYELTHNIYTGSLDDDESTDVTMRLELGTQYAIMGVCDNDCSDIDLTLYDAAGNQIDQDIAADDYPLVEVTPRRSATYRVRVTMADCSAEPCRYGLGTFGK